VAPEAARRPVERMLIRGGKALVVVLIGGAVWGVLALSFFLCRGFDGCALADARLSRLGSVITIGLVWPALGLACLIGGVVVQALPELVARVFGRLWIGEWPRGEGGGSSGLRGVRARVQSWDRRQ
jgi:hypothetical protein